MKIVFDKLYEKHKLKN